jgi:hypothetical protein
VLATTARTRPSTDVAVPHDVTDVMLWRLAFDVAVEHQRGPDGSCTNLRCAGQHGPCEPAVQAQRALQAAREPTTPAPQAATPNGAGPATAPPTVRTDQRPDRIVGRTTVIQPNAGRFTGWFTHTATPAANRWLNHHLPRRIPGVALVAA